MKKQKLLSLGFVCYLIIGSVNTLYAQDTCQFNMPIYEEYELNAFSPGQTTQETSTHAFCWKAKVYVNTLLRDPDFRYVHIPALDLSQGNLQMGNHTFTCNWPSNLASRFPGEIDFVRCIWRCVGF